MTDKSVDDLAWSVVEQFFNIDLDKVSTHLARIADAKDLLTNVLLPMNRDYALISLDGEVRIADLTSLHEPMTRDPAIWEAWMPRTVPSFMSPAGFRTVMANRKATVVRNGQWTKAGVADLWLQWRDRRDYRQGLLFAPKVEQSDMPHHFNTWRGWGFKVDLTEPARPEAWSGLREHMQECYFGGREHEYTWFMAWLADLFQNPTRKPGSAVVIRGTKGSGKTLIADVMKYLVGRPYFVRLDKPSQLTGEFNGHLQGTLLVNVEEGFWSGDKRAEGTLKSWITSDEVMIRLMRTNAFPARNYSRFLFTSNERWTVPADFGDRRFFPIECASNYVGNRAHFDRIWTELNNCGGFEEFLKFLLTFKAPAWVDLRKPPATAELARQVEQGMAVPDRFFWNAAKTGEGFPCGGDGGEFYRSGVSADFSDWCHKHGDRYAATNAVLFADLMTKYWYVERVGRRVNHATGDKETLYRIPSLNEVRENLTLAYDLPDGMLEVDDEDDET